MLQVAEKPERAKLLTKVGSDFITASPDKKAAEWLEGHIAKSQDKITTVVADLTPALARVLLARNDGNRRTRQGIVEGYARDMKNGGWDMNGEPLIIARNGLMNDGQHRCLAVVQSDTAIPAVFVIGVDRDTRSSLDQGAVRRLADYLSMDGYTDALRLAAVAGYIWQYLTFGAIHSAGRAKPTKGELRRLIDEHPNIAQSVKFVDGKGIHKITSITVLATCHWIFAKANKRAADEFITSFIDGAGLNSKNPILYVRNRLIAERGSIKANGTAELLFKAWNAWRKGETLQRLVVFGGKLPKVEK